MGFKPFCCMFWDDVVCSSQKYRHYVFLPKCESCSHYLRFVSLMEEEEEQFFAEVDELHKYGYEYVDRKRRWNRRGL